MRCINILTYLLTYLNVCWLGRSGQG